MRIHLLAAASLLFAAPALARPVHEYLEVAVAPDGAHLASIEGDQTPSGEVDIQRLVLRTLPEGKATTIALPCGAVRECTPSALAWEPDGKQLAFVLRSPSSHAHAIYTVPASGGAPTRLLSLDGTLGGLRYGPGGALAVLAIPSATKEVGAVEAGAPLAGVLGDAVHEQRIALVTPDHKPQFASPPDLFVYEYDWRPDGSGFIGTAAPGDGDDHWWIAKLYGFDRGTGQAHLLFAPKSPHLQIASPLISPDGSQIAFIGGIMSDFGATGGDIYVLPAGGGAATDITAGTKQTAMAIGWDCKPGAGLIATELAGDRMRIVARPAGEGSGKTLYDAAETLGGWQGIGVQRSCGTETTALVRQSFTRPPEIAVGPLGHWQTITHDNDGLTAPAEARSLSWNQDGFGEQGWLLLPTGAKTAAKLPMITEVHGGPAWANLPRFIGDGLQRKLLEAGYAMFLPNPRGSYGQGEAFTRANVKDFGGGDLRDILAGVDASIQAAPIDPERLGITGWSYGGYMTMWAVTQTNRFRAAVAGAGLSDWLSYYGENGIDGWMIPYFGASVYDDPAVYAKSSPINFVRNVRTPTLMVVGADDIECPAPQTEEFWHALKTLGVPTEAVIYPGEGHWMHDPAHVADIERRLVGWFQKYLTAGGKSG